MLPYDATRAPGIACSSRVVTGPMPALVTLSPAGTVTTASRGAVSPPLWYLARIAVLT